MKYCIFIFVFIFHIYPSWAREPLLADIVDKDINITASFDGAKIVIYGAIDTKLHKDSILIINVLGPSSHLKLERKKNFGEHGWPAIMKWYLRMHQDILQALVILIT